MVVVVVVVVAVAVAVVVVVVVNGRFSLSQESLMKGYDNFRQGFDIQHNTNLCLVVVSTHLKNMGQVRDEHKNIWEATT